MSSSPATDAPVVDATVDVVVLGPVGLLVAGVFVAPTSQVMRVLLASLALAPGRELTADSLADRLWRDRPSNSALTVAVHRLRRWLAETAGEAVSVVRTTTGYRLVLDRGDTDIERFADLREQARRHEPAEAARLLERALALWRDHLLADVPERTADPTAVSELGRHRVDATLELGRALLAAGDAQRAAGLLTNLARRHPLDEPLHAVLVHTLAAAGDQVGALTAYERLRERLADELGIDPSAELQRAYLAVLHQEVRTAKPAENPRVPSQLPADHHGFTGREEILRQLDKMQTEADAEEAPLVAVVSGMPGAGKTALAVRWAHRVEERFPDGRLYLNLRGFSPGAEPLRTREALGRLLRSAGVSGADVPANEDEAAAEFRSRTAGRRFLLLLDNARTAEQVRPLLPGGSSCCTIVTSRDQLAGLVARDGAQRVVLGPLGESEATRLLATLLGDRTHREPAATADLARLCGRLPLALRITAANLGSHPATSVTTHVARIQGGDLLGALAVSGDPEAAVRTAFDLSFDTLSPPAQRLFGLHGLVPGADVTLPALASLSGASLAATRAAADELVLAHLLEQQDGDRYGLHDLLCHYARERVPPGEAGPAVPRLAEWYVAHVDAAVSLADPHWVRLPVRPSAEPVEFRDRAEAMHWLTAERANIVATVEYTAAAGPRELGRRLANGVLGYLHLATHVTDAHAVAAAELAAVDAIGPAATAADRAAAALDMTWVCERLSHYDDAIRHGQRAAALAEEAGWPAAQSCALGVLGVVFGQTGRTETGIEHAVRALEISQANGFLALEAWQLGDLGIGHLWLGRLDRAEENFRRALGIHRRLGSRTGENLSTIALGQVALEAGRLDDAVGHLAAAAELVRHEGRILGWPRIFNTLAAVHVEAGRYDDAIAACRTALPVADASADRVVRSSLLNNLGDAYLGLGRYQECAEAHQQALTLAQQTGLVRHQGGALLGLARCRRRTGEIAHALEYAEKALRLEQASRRIWREGQALTELAACELTAGRPEAAAEHAAAAVTLHRTAGHRLAEERAQQILDRTSDA